MSSRGLCTTIRCAPLEITVPWLCPSRKKFLALPLFQWNTNTGLHTPYSRVSLEWPWVTLRDFAKYSMTQSVARSLCNSRACSDFHEELVGMYTYWVYLLRCQFHWMQQLYCLLRCRSVILINSQLCNVVLCIANSLWYNMLYWGNSIGIGRPFFITNQSGVCH